ncbi:MULTISPECIES: hypothetical protein [Streptomyces violaceusniger group]|nr:MULTISPECIES: hypothetical protein [Streptomyces violaceusniger group]
MSTSTPWPSRPDSVVRREHPVDFPAFTEAAPVTALEIEALRALHVTL